MSWSQILNQNAALDRFQRSVRHNRLASTYLFVGPKGVGKHTFALKLAETLLCESRTNEFEPCENCPDCAQVQSRSHPDLILVSKPADKAFIPVETFIGDKEHRRQVGLCHDIGLKPFRGKRKVAIIDDADFLNQEGANSLLKTLEEPPPNSLLILIGTSEQRQLSTIVSRSQVVRFSTLTNDQVFEVLQHHPNIDGDDVPLRLLADASEGSVYRAIQLADPETLEFRNHLIQQLAGNDPGKDDFAKTVTAFVDGVGKESAKKRERLGMIGDIAISFYRQCIVQLAGNLETGGDPSLNDSVESAISPWQDNPIEGADRIACCLERCTEMQRQVASNAGAANVVDAWLRDLGRITRGENTTLV